jgi:NAD(P)-dependent dehydrogenase (short-subunit alcohol dehydrogenase family)
MEDLNGKVAVVTGAASGIGLATATRFCEEGMRVVLADIEEPKLNDAVERLEGKGHEVIGVPVDVSDWQAIQALAKATMDAFGAVHVLHNNAGVVVSGPIAELSLADWEWVLGVDLWSVIYGIKAFLPLIRESGEGHIVSTASTAGLQSAPSIGPYNVAKFGVVALSETLRMELAAEKSGVSASVLCPGAINTQIVQSKRNRPAESAREHKASDAERRFEESSGKLLSQRGKDPADVAEMIVQAILKDEFWILTHPDWKDVLSERVAAMKRDNSLHTGFGG